MQLPTFKLTLSFLQETVKKNKNMRNIMLLQKNDKYKVVKRKPAAGYDSISVSYIFSYLEQTLIPSNPSYSHLNLY